METTFTLTKKEAKFLKMASEPRARVPILRCALVSVIPGQDGRVKLTSTDMDEWFTMTTTSVSEPGEEFSFCVTVDKLLAVVDGGQLTIRKRGEQYIVRNSLGIEVQSDYASEDYPTMPEVQTVKSFTIKIPSGKAAKRLLTVTSENGQYYMGGVSIQPGVLGGCWAFATDGSRLQGEQIERWDEDVPSMLIPRDTFALLSEVFDGHLAWVSETGGQFCALWSDYNGKGCRVYWRAVDGQFPQAVRVFDKTQVDAMHVIHLDKRGVIALQRTLEAQKKALKSESSRLNGVSLSLSDSHLGVQRHSPESITDPVRQPVEVNLGRSSMDYPVGLSVNFLIDALVGAEQATIGFCNSESAIFVNISDTSKTVIMTMRLDYPAHTAESHQEPAKQPEAEPEAPAPEPTPEEPEPVAVAPEETAADPQDVKFTIEYPGGEKLGEFSVPKHEEPVVETPVEPASSSGWQSMSYEQLRALAAKASADAIARKAARLRAS